MSDNNCRIPVFTRRRIIRGFTLLELMIVLLIIGFMSALVVPRLTGPMSNLNLKTASRQISSSLKYIRSIAASEKTIYVALFDLDNNRMVIARSKTSPLVPMDNVMPIDRPDDDQAPSKGIKTYELPDRVRLSKGTSREGDFNSGQFRIFFYPSGGSSGGEIILANDRGRQYKIDVDFITGSVSLSEVTG